MNIALLKNVSDEANITFQQKQILKYAHHHDLHLDTTEIETSDTSLQLEKRKEFKGFLRSLSPNDHIFIFNLSTFSQKVDELVKIFECLLTRSISIHLIEANVCIHTATAPLVLLELLVKQRELNIKSDQEKLQGRPKGRMSKSKFDTYRPRIIELLEQELSISEIAKMLDVSRTSLKDYVNSRGLKDLVKAKLSLLQTPKKATLTLKTTHKKEECSLIKISEEHQEGIPQ